MEPDSPVPYRLTTPHAILERLKNWATQAAAGGFHDEFIGHLREMQEQLATTPLTWGEERFKLRGRKVRVLHRGMRLFHVSYGVDEEARTVFVMGVHLVGYTPLTDGETSQ